MTKLSPIALYLTKLYVTYSEIRQNFSKSVLKCTVGGLYPPPVGSGRLLGISNRKPIVPEIDTLTASEEKGKGEG